MKRVTLYLLPFALGAIFAAPVWAQPPSVDITMSQLNYFNGDTIKATEFRIKNLGVEAQKAEIKVWLKIPGLTPFTIINLGDDGSFMLAAGFNQDLGPLPLLAVSPSLPRGAYEFSSRVLNPVTGSLLSEDLNVFNVSDPPAAAWVTDDVASAGTVNVATLGVPILQIVLNQASYVVGETVRATDFRFQNLTDALATVEVKVWLKMPGTPALSVLNLGANGSFSLAVDFDHNLGPLSLFTISASMPKGTYEFSSRMVDPVTGALISQDLNTFVVQ